MRALTVAGLLALAAAAAAAGAHVRGVRPELADKYAPVGGMFRCLDGSKSIPFSAVNDNYCDCGDSSDEPGARRGSCCSVTLTASLAVQ